MLHWNRTVNPWEVSPNIPVYFPCSTEFNYLLASSITFFPPKHGSITLSSSIQSLQAGLSNRICLIVYNSLIHISATHRQPRSTLMSLWERIMSSKQSLDCVFSGWWRTACRGGVGAESPVKTGVMASDSELIPPVYSAASSGLRPVASDLETVWWSEEAVTP